MSILRISKEASDRQKINKSTINGSTGVFILEDGTISNVLVNDFLKHTNSHSIAPYLNIEGSYKFKTKVLDWVFKEGLDSIINHHHLSLFQTIGGSGAIDITLNNFGNKEDFVLVPNIAWDYKSFINKSNKRIYEYNLFAGGVFDIKSFNQALKEVSQRQKEIIVVLNDPAHNPTGYTLTKNERKAIWKSLNEYTNNDIILLYDLAYFDYDNSYNNREVFLELNKLEPHVISMLAVSGSKSFSLYGTRVGALIGLFKNEEKNSIFYNKVHSYVVGSYSAPVTFGNEALIYILNRDYNTHIAKLEKELKERRNIFIQESKNCGLDLYPTNSGFFLFIKSNDNLADYDKLASEDIFLVPMNGGLRISLSSLRKEQLNGLATRIYNIIKN